MGGRTVTFPQASTVRLALRETISEAEYMDAAEAIGCSVAAIKAVAQVESRGSGFDREGRPKILFERHWFRRLTKRQYDESHPHLSFRYLKPRDNPSYRKDQWELMREAASLDPSAAIQSASWGRFQIMGFNYRLCACKTPEQFARRMFESASQHLLLFCAFLQAKGLNRALAALDFEAFATGYNGPDHASNNYVKKLSREFDRFSSSGNSAASAGASVRGLIKRS